MKGKIIMSSVLLALVNLMGCRAEQPVPWEHGYKTSRVIATYRPNTHVGYTIKMEFPRNGADSDRAEISDLLEDLGCMVYESGGSADAPAYMICKGVTDDVSAAKKMKEVLPQLSELLGGLNNPIVMRKFKALHKITEDKQPKWPHTTPIDKADPNWQFNNNQNVNGTQYMKQEVAPGDWQWVVNSAAMNAIQESENSRQQLFSDLSTRKLSHNEMMGVYPGINIQNMTSYFAVDKYAELYASLVKQWELQTGRKMEGYRPLSTAKGEYNRSPQEDDSRHAVEEMIRKLQDMTKVLRISD